jgi:hypothetical protein
MIFTKIENSKRRVESKPRKKNEFKVMLSFWYKCRIQVQMFR